MSRFKKLKNYCEIVKLSEITEDYNYVEDFDIDGVVTPNLEREFNNVKFFKEKIIVQHGTKMKDALEYIDIVYNKRILYRIDKYIYLFLRYHPETKTIFYIKPCQLTQALKGENEDEFIFEATVAFE